MSGNSQPTGSQPSPLTRLLPWPGGHGMIFGTTGSGKSTLNDHLIIETSRTMPDARILIIDSKRRYKASHDLNGRKAERHYRSMRGGAFIPNSLRLPLFASPRDLKQAWELAPGNIIIAQTDKAYQYGWLNAMVMAHYEHANKKFWNLVSVDEMLALTQNRANALGVKTIAICGRERGVFLLGCSQRPKWIPIEVMSEMSNCYLFNINFHDDVLRLADMGFPRFIAGPDGEKRPLLPPPFDHSFWMWDGRKRGLARLKLSL